MVRCNVKRQKRQTIIILIGTIVLLYLYGWVQTDDHNTMMVSRSATHPALDHQASQVDQVVVEFFKNRN